MKLHKLGIIIPTALVVLLSGANTAKSSSAAIELARTLPADPIIVDGKSGGSKQTKCGFISEAPSQLIKVTSAQIDYMRLRVESNGQPTLMVDGPGGKFCVLAVAGEKPEISGVWRQGTYKIHVGDRQGGSHPYKLYITQKSN